MSSTSPEMAEALVASSPVAERGLIPRVLRPALQWWLSSQLEQATGLEIEIQGGDRQLLRGYLPHVRIAAATASYRGIQLRQAAVQAEQIQINLGQVLRGQPLKLLAPVPLRGELVLSQADLNASLRAPLLQSGLRELLKLLHQRGLGKPGVDLQEWQLLHTQGELGTGCLKLRFSMVNAQGEQGDWHLMTHVRLQDERTLCLEKVHWQGEREIHPTVTIDLGDGVAIQELRLEAAALRVQGMVCIYP
ncbi:hypothetical protein NK55_07955 [Thermosynechococcus sp. NK55a]|uniref:LmeA family phospholipid-binding protein n=1 Tax=unclassified Thermosynechococcus TaxID=2622553 RepID=UPI0003D7CAAE|nr:MULTISPECIES: DUF2993 domain-containing protein [unclassified Thermosynechococcus]AHB88872.1 hypothetical protein NK55_07955 [Thermosynechococcus sp. NK55a]HIK24095.1 DUF2993 domain-containing protein [Thermosynechococcus sp. M3746_W2019_013]